MIIKKLSHKLFLSAKIFLIGAFAAPSVAHADEVHEPGSFGLGVGGFAGTYDRVNGYFFGSGASAKVFVYDHVAFQTLIGIAGSDRGGPGWTWPMINPELTLFFPFYTGESVQFTVYGGGGVHIPLNSIPRIGQHFYDSIMLNAIGALTMDIIKVPMDISIELRPIIPFGLWEPAAPSLTAGFHTRYYFR